MQLQVMEMLSLLSVTYILHVQSFSVFVIKLSVRFMSLNTPSVYFDSLLQMYRFFFTKNNLVCYHSHIMSERAFQTD